MQQLLECSGGGGVGVGLKHALCFGSREHEFCQLETSVTVALVCLLSDGNRLEAGGRHTGPLTANSPCLARALVDDVVNRSFLVCTYTTSFELALHYGLRFIHQFPGPVGSDACQTFPTILCMTFRMLVESSE